MAASLEPTRQHGTEDRKEVRGWATARILQDYRPPPSSAAKAPGEEEGGRDLAAR
jgi:hypothetical protein